MTKVFEIDKLPLLINSLQQEGKRAVVAGGCFDLLHPGHIAFLEAAKKEGDVLIVLLEHDAAIAQTKGENRPVQPQKDRALILSALGMTDYILPLPTVFSDKDYDELILAIKPAIIATTEGDAYRHHKERQAKLVGATVKDVLPRLSDYSTSTLLKKKKLL